MVVTMKNPIFWDVTSSQRALVVSYCWRCSLLTDSCYPDDGGATLI
jgi:hypothetical protein